MIFEIIPVLEVNETCQWCEPQQCFTASVWWGNCLLSFYTPHAERLERDALNEAACNVLKQITSVIKPESETVISSDEMWDAIGNAGCFAVYWSDFRPACIIGFPSHCCIPVEEAAEASQQ